MMYQKAMLFGDADTAARIMKITSCAQIKALGRTVRGFDEGKWDAAAMDIVTAGNMLKFGQNAALKAALLATGTAMIVEASPNDRIWGIGISEADAQLMPPANWPGQNKLGQCLMRVRDSLANAPPAPTPTPATAPAEKKSEARSPRPTTYTTAYPTARQVIKARLYPFQDIKPADVPQSDGVPRVL